MKSPSGHSIRQLFVLLSLLLFFLNSKAASTNLASQSEASDTQERLAPHSDHQLYTDGEVLQGRPPGSTEPSESKVALETPLQEAANTVREDSQSEAIEEHAKQTATQTTLPENGVKQEVATKVQSDQLTVATKVQSDQITVPVPAPEVGGAALEFEPSAEPGLVEAKVEAEEEEEDRHNFALAKDGAKVVAANKEAKKTSALLDSDGDTFLKNECKADKWVIVELSQVAKMDTLVISQNELYSSRIKEFEVRGRQSHPRTDGTDYVKMLNASTWQLLGRFNASNVKGSQAFRIERPTWLKYLQIRLLSHYGTEAVCALNDVCIYGKSAAEDLEDRLSLETPEEGEALVQPMPALDPVSIPALPDAAPQDLASSVNLTSQPELLINATKEGAQASALQQKIEIAMLPKQEGVQASPTKPAAEVKPHSSHSRNIDQADASFTPAAATDKQAGIEGKDPVHVDVVKPGVVPEKEAPPAAAEGIAGGSNAGEEQLPVNSAGSAANRHGGSVYDLLVQELKAIKLGQKASARTLAQLQKNVTAVMGGFAFELDLLASRVSQVDPARPAILPPGTSIDPLCGLDPPQAVVGSNGSRDVTGAGLDFREVQCTADGLSQPSIKVVRPPTELELLQQEVTALREMIQQSRLEQQADIMLLALAFSLLGGVGASCALHAIPGRLLLKSLLLVFASIPIGLVSCIWAKGA